MRGVAEQRDPPAGPIGQRIAVAGRILIKFRRCRDQGLRIDVPNLISATPEFYEYPTCDRDPLPYWSTGRVTLLGDAAHPMYPVGSNGASQAILDARYLADLLARAEHPRQALLAYEQKRLPMTAEIVRSNRRGGPEGVIDAVEQLAPDGFTDIDKVLSYS